MDATQESLYAALKEKAKEKELEELQKKAKVLEEAKYLYEIQLAACDQELRNIRVKIAEVM